MWVELLPYLEQDNLYKLWDYNDNRNNVAGARNASQAQVIKILLCPSDPAAGTRGGNRDGQSAPPWCVLVSMGRAVIGGNAGNPQGKTVAVAGIIPTDPGRHLLS